MYSLQEMIQLLLFFQLIFSILYIFCYLNNSILPLVIRIMKLVFAYWAFNFDFNFKLFPGALDDVDLA